MPLIIEEQIATELNVKTAQVLAAIQLLDEGATVPFIARYRKEATGGLDDTQLRHLEERLIYLRELEERRKSILASVCLVLRWKQGSSFYGLPVHADRSGVLPDGVAVCRPDHR